LVCTANIINLGGNMKFVPGLFRDFQSWIIIAGDSLGRPPAILAPGCPKGDSQQSPTPLSDSLAQE
jgi:hypothetical protein